MVRRHGRYADASGAMARLCRRAEDHHVRQERRRAEDLLRWERRTRLLRAAGTALVAVVFLGAVWAVMRSFA